jgi:hypothetical protein
MMTMGCATTAPRTEPMVGAATLTSAMDPMLDPNPYVDKPAMTDEDPWGPVQQTSSLSMADGF